MVVCIGRPSVLCFVVKSIENTPSFNIFYFGIALCIFIVLSAFAMVICALACGKAIRLILGNKCGIANVRNGINLKFNGNGCVSCYIVKCVSRYCAYACSVDLNVLDVITAVGCNREGFIFSFCYGNFARRRNCAVRTCGCGDGVIGYGDIFPNCIEGTLALTSYS